MDHLLKLLDDLDAKAKAATPGPWDTGEGCSGPYLSFAGHAPSGGGLEEPYDDGSEPLWLGGTVAKSDRVVIVAAVNAAPMLSRIVRETSERPWFKRRSGPDDDSPDVLRCLICDDEHTDGGKATHAGECEMLYLDRYLDAAEAAARKGARP